MAEIESSNTKFSFYDKFIEKVNNESGNKEDRIERILRSDIERGIIKKDTELSVSELAGILKVSRNTVSAALKKLENDGIIRAESARPYIVIRKEPIYPAKRSSNLSISKWSKENGITMKTRIVSCDSVTIQDIEKLNEKDQDQRIINKIKDSLKVNKDTKLLEIRRLREFRGNREEDKFRKGIVEVSFINPIDETLCTDMSYFYSLDNEENWNIGFHDFFTRKGLVLVRSEFEIKARNLNFWHISPWINGTKETDMVKIERIIKKNPEVQKPFLRMNCTTYCQNGPVEFSISYFDTDVISIASTVMEPLFVPD